MVTAPLTCRTPQAPPAPWPAAALPLVAVLRQLAAVVGAMTPEQYARKPVGAVTGSVGGHVRHCLDHVAALLGSLDEGFLDYDRRERGTAVEASPAAALEALAGLERQLLALRAADATPLVLRTTLSSALPPVEVNTTLGREMAFVLSHTIHHNALIGVAAQILGVPVPERFGYAPSTIAFLEGRS